MTHTHFLGHPPGPGGLRWPGWLTSPGSRRSKENFIQKSLKNVTSPEIISADKMAQTSHSKTIPKYT